MRASLTAVPLAAALVLAACTDQPTAPSAAPNRSVAGAAAATRYVVLGTADALPSDLAARVQAAGGELVRTHSEIGVAIAQSASAGFAARLARGGGIESVTADQVIQWLEPVQSARVAAAGLEAGAASGVDAEATSIGDGEPFYFLQWAPPAIGAPAAWNAGFTGAGVRVAILDGGIYSGHPDLAPNLDVAASASFVPGVAWNQDLGTFWHGTHVAGIVGAAANGIGTIGIAPEATLVGVKVLHGGSGAFEWVIDGILYAARPQAEGGGGADVINMSLGATIDDKLKSQKADVRELRKAIDRATRYAWQQGVTVIASAGNGGLNLDVEKTLWKTPAQNQHVLSISATGPVGWAAFGNTDFARPTYYTDHGKSLVDLAAPGGTLGLYVVDGYDALCNVGGVVNFCEAFDAVLSTSRGTTAAGAYSWAQGTSMAAPAASAVAALVIQQAGGSLGPAQVRARLQQSAIDLGKPGQDEWYGHGWVNAARAVQQ